MIDGTNLFSVYLIYEYSYGVFCFCNLAISFAWKSLLNFFLSEFSFILSVSLNWNKRINWTTSNPLTWQTTIQPNQCWGASLSLRTRKGKKREKEQRSEPSIRPNSASLLLSIPSGRGSCSSFFSGTHPAAFVSSYISLFASHVFSFPSSNNRVTLRQH